jgi:hypothetical protein
MFTVTWISRDGAIVRHVARRFRRFMAALVGAPAWLHLQSVAL